MSVTQEQAIELLRGLVAIPSLSGQEMAASTWLVEQMHSLGYERAFVDAASNAVGEMGHPDAAHTVILLGHIDTVPGNIPVRIESTAAGDLLYGRGSVDAKGPLATFVAAVAKIGAAWAQAHNLRLVVVGAVEEEAATSKGARFIADRFNGQFEPMPVACIIGEPSNWQRVTLGYKGRLLIEVTAAQAMAHTAGPEASVATVAVDLWNWVAAYAARVNQGRDKAFDQLLPSLRTINTSTDANMYDQVSATIGLRLPLELDATAFATELIDWACQRIQVASPLLTPHSSLINLHDQRFDLSGPLTQLTLRFYAHELPWRGERNNFLVRSFIAALRDLAPDLRPGFVLKTGTSDMNVVGPRWQCPLLAYGPGDSALDHTPNEHLNLVEYGRAIALLEQALRYLPELLATA